MCEAVVIASASIIQQHVCILEWMCPVRGSVDLRLPVGVPGRGCRYTRPSGALSVLLFSEFFVFFMCLHKLKHTDTCKHYR